MNQPAGRHHHKFREVLLRFLLKQGKFEFHKTYLHTSKKLLVYKKSLKKESSCKIFCSMPNEIRREWHMDA